MGASVIALGIAGEDQAAPIQQHLGSLGIQARFREIEGETRTNLKLIEQADGRLTEINGTGPEVSRPPRSNAIIRPRIRPARGVSIRDMTRTIACSSQPFCSQDPGRSRSATVSLVTHFGCFIPNQPAPGRGGRH